MGEQTSEWPRAHFERPGGRPFLFYVVYGAFPNIPQVDSQVYRTLGIHPGLKLSIYGRYNYPEVFAGYQQGYLWDELSVQDPLLARKVSESERCLILRGELDDRSDLDYLRDSIGLVTCLLDHGGVCVYDPQMFRWWAPEDWRRHIFEPDGPVPGKHVVILTSNEDESGVTAEPLIWFHTRGMRKFGRPDLSIHSVPAQLYEAVIDLFERFIQLQAFGGVIAQGQEIRMRSLPLGMTCWLEGDLEDPEFNNVHIEITSPE